ncbi:DUF6349 family protein [Streptomyces malaysiensis]|uniref:DUF6349 family protein n=1 Tax=Streptomyces malaysiensis TaxID=92644 RepID=UPI00384C2AA8
MKSAYRRGLASCRGGCWGRRTGPIGTRPAHDHSHPGWRDLPAMPERRGRHWLAHVQRIYPGGWFDRGGPIRTVRTGIEKHHKPGAAPGGGYDLGSV